MPAGTLTLTNNSAVVKGAGTAFNTELKAGDMIVSVVGGVTYTLPVKTVDSATQATLIKAYDGPTQAGAAWYAVPREAMNLITAQLAAETAKALRGLNLDKNNWQQVFSGTGNITVTLPDGSTYTGPAWNSFTSALNLKADKTDLDKKADKDELDKKANKTDLGNSASRNVGTTAGTVAEGNDGRLNTINGKSGGMVNGIIGAAGVNGNNANSYLKSNPPRLTNPGDTNDYGGFSVGWASGASANYSANGLVGFKEFVGNYFYTLLATYAGGTWFNWEFRQGGNAVATGGSWINASDGRIKTKKEIIISPLAKMRMLRGYTWERLDNGLPGQGFIAQELQEVFPNAVFKGGPTTLKDGTVIEDTLAIDISGASAALHHEAILALMDRIDSQDEIIKKLMEKLQ